MSQRGEPGLRGPAADASSESGPLRPLSEPGLSDPAIWALVDAAPDAMILTDQSGRILLVNRQTEELFGYERSELLGRPVEELLPERLRQVHRAHRTRYQAEPRTRSMGSNLTLSGRRQDGTEFPVEVSLSPVTVDAGAHVVAAVRDISERLAMDADARGIRALLDATRDGVFIFDSETLRFTYVNDGAVEQVGYSRDELLAMSPLHIAPELTEPEFRERLAPVRAGRATSTMFTTVHRRRDGVDMPVEVLVQAPRADDGTVRAFVAAVRDISERVEAEERLREAGEELRLLDERERIARDLHDTVIQRLFATGMSLQTVSALVDRDTRAAARIDEAIDDLDQTIRDIRAAIYGLQSQVIRRAGLRSEILRIIEEAQAAYSVVPTLRLAGAIEAVPDTIAEHLLATLREALSNVGRHAAATRVDIDIRVDDHVELRVADDGVGLPADRSGGNGLQNMEGRALRLGGTFRIDPGADRGTVVVWTVPADPGRE